MQNPIDDIYHEALSDEAATLAFGAKLSQFLVPPLIIFLKGDLGAGKTTLVRGVMRGLGFMGRVKSPTYALLEVYAVSRLNLYHFDFYRLSDPDEWHEAGFRDYMNAEAICLIEWPEKALGAGLSLPVADVMLTLTPTANNQRTLMMQSSTPAGHTLLSKLHA
jgi:tRNA threonylcarbamoyladenosine biosynthesis protein TsaE